MNKIKIATQIIFMTSIYKINENWTPLQTKVFSRWTSNQLKDFADTDVVIDIQKDLSNGVALVELAISLTNKKEIISWTKIPKLKSEMVQNCNLAIDIFAKDGVNLVGISGKDISDNNQKTILDLIWTLILHYSIERSLKITQTENRQIINEKRNKSNIKSNIDELLSWANQRIENYPNIHNFIPYDLAICALLDSYFPNKINFYSLNPKDSEYNLSLAVKIMNEIGIPIYVYPEDLKKFKNSVNEKILLTQLSSAKVVLDAIQANKKTNNTKSFQLNEKAEIDMLKDKIKELEMELQIQNEAREIAENEAERLNLELSHIKIAFEEEKVARMEAENNRQSQQIEWENDQKLIENLTHSLEKLQNNYQTIYSEIIENNSEVQRLRIAWDMAQIEIENERDYRQEVESQLENLKKKFSSFLNHEKDMRIQSFMSSFCDIECKIQYKLDQFDSNIDAITNKVFLLKSEIEQESKKDLVNFEEKSKKENKRSKIANVNCSESIHSSSKESIELREENCH